VLESGCAEVLIARVLGRHHGVDVDGTQTSLRLLLAEHDVDGGGDDVKVFAVDEVDEETEDQDEVRPEEDSVPGLMMETIIGCRAHATGARRSCTPAPSRRASPAAPRGRALLQES
jgi:hypothetical protein